MAEFVYQMIKEFDRKDPNSEKGWDGWSMSVGRWIKDGEALPPSLQRQTLKLEDGEVVSRGNKGFRLADLEILKKNWKEIVGLLKNPPKYEAPKAEETPAEEPGSSEGSALEEVPF